MKDISSSYIYISVAKVKPLSKSVMAKLYIKYINNKKASNKFKTEILKSSILR